MITHISGFNIKEGKYNLNEYFDEDTLFTYYYYNKNLDNYNLGFSTVEQYNVWVDSASVWFNDLDELEPNKYFTSNADYYI